jgi:hypothetical protein
VRRFNQYDRQNALVSADPFGDSDWHRCLVVAGASSSLGAYVRFLRISLMLPPVAPQTGLRAMVNVVHVRTDHLAGERTCKRGDCVSHLASAAGEPALATFATTAVEAEERQTTAADAALVSCIIMTRTQAMREEEYRDG